ncbi:hypothetical protein HY622_01290 [Candidatus Uhrbacteria bacterium]|nr:hypothetical protein [Candidatus Uhrbacteria bacterium]
MEDQLQELGFSPKEVKVYLALLELGQAQITPLARKAGINRTTTYDVVSSLMREGLIHRVLDTKKETYKAHQPERIPQILERRIEELAEKQSKATKMVAQLHLLASKAPGKPRVSIFEGAEGIKEMYEDTLLSREPIVSFSSTESLESFDQNYLHDYYQRRAKKKVFIRAIINDVKSAHEYQSLDKKLYRSLRIVPQEMMDIGPEVYVYDNKTAFFSLKERYGVLIESADIATSLKKLYELAWHRAGELDAKIKRRQK